MCGEGRKGEEMEVERGENQKEKGNEKGRRGRIERDGK